MRPTPIITTADIDIAYTDDQLWTVTHNGGEHCTTRTADHTGCPLPVNHTGDCIPTTDELLNAGVRLHPCASL